MASLLIVWSAWFLAGCSSDRPSTPGAALCSTQEWLEAPGPRLLCTTAQVADLVAAIAGPHAAVLVLIDGDLDPHSYQLVKGDDEKLSVADRVFASGLGLEHGPSLQQFLAESPKVIRLGDAIRSQPGVELIRADGQWDPHIWLDVSLWRRTVRPIVESLIQLSPNHRMEFESRGELLEQNLEALDQELLERFQAIPMEKRYLVTSHDAFQYFTRRYLASPEERPTQAWRERLCAPEGLAPEGQLGLTDIQRVLTFCQDHQVEVLFPESNVNTSPLKKVVDSGRRLGLPLRLSAEPLYGDTMGEEASCNLRDAYQMMMRTNANVITREWMQGVL